jgi:protein-S-isoprenylcysteine O-methyltransferase Ste14
LGKNYGTLALIVIALAIFARNAWALPWTVQHIAGLVARVQLGNAFSVKAKATTLVTTGLYSRIRNPVYFFGALMILGVIVWVSRPWMLLFYVVLIPVQVIRIRKEEKVLTEKFGEAYVEYKRKTWF